MPIPTIIYISLFLAILGCTICAGLNVRSLVHPVAVFTINWCAVFLGVALYAIFSVWGQALA